MEIKIAVIGDRGSVMGFKAAGFHVFEMEAESSIAGLMADLVKANYGIVFVTEELISGNRDMVNQYKDDMMPAVLPIPGRKGSLGIGIDHIHRNVEKAVGADILRH